MAPTKKRLEEIFRKVFSRPTLTITETTTAKDVPGWDSLTHITLLLSVEKEFQVRFATKEIIGLQNVGSLIRLIEEKSSGGNP